MSPSLVVYKNRLHKEERLWRSNPAEGGVFGLAEFFKAPTCYNILQSCSLFIPLLLKICSRFAPVALLTATPCSPQSKWWFRPYLAAGSSPQ